MKIEIKKEIIEAMEAYMQLHGISANKMADACGVNAGYISAMRKGMYYMMVGDKEVEFADKHYLKIAEVVGHRLEKTYWETRPTPQFISTMATLEEARNHGTTNLVIGETGSGKTYAVRLFVRTYPTDTFLITVGANDNMIDLIDKLSEKLKVGMYKSKSKRMRDIIRELRVMKHNGFKPTVIFDEAEYMKIHALCSMKELYDNLNGIASVVLVGTHQLTKNIEKLKLKDRDGIPQLYRRIKFGIKYLPNIDTSFKEFVGGFEKGLIKFLQENCDNYGELHDVLVPSMREADRLGQPLTEGLVRTVLNMPK